MALLELSLQSLFVTLSLIIGFISYLPYLITTLKGQTKPHIFSWIIWALLMSIAFCAQYLEGAGPGAWMTALGAFMCMIIVVLAWKHGEKNFTKSDKISFGLALSVIPIWLLTHDPVLAVLLVTGIDLVGFYPTYRKSYHKPHQEPALTYFLNGVSFLFAILALDIVSITTALYPLALVIGNLGLVFLLFVRRRTLI